MTQEQQDKLRRALYNAKFTTDAHDENPFVGAYFNDLLDILHDFEAEIYRDGWLAGEANLAKEYKRIQWIKWIPVEERLSEIPKNDWKSGNVLFVVNGEIFYGYRGKYTWFAPFVPFNNHQVTHWMEIVPPQGKEE